MEITINNQLKKLIDPQPITVQQLLNKEIPARQQGIAIAINNQVIPKSQWNKIQLSSHDQITIIRATQGG